MDQPLFGIYVHIPFCRQICPYCDFTKFRLGQQITPEDYTSLLVHEISNRPAEVSPQSYSSLYFGGGTPSLLPVSEMVRVLGALEKAGFTPRPGAEITLEIDPGTFNREQLREYIRLGFNRFSLGVQSFSAQALIGLGRTHTPEDARAAVRMLQEEGALFSVDLMFGLPNQTLSAFEEDLQNYVALRPDHISTYILTLPSYHRLNQGRADDDTQVQMFDLLDVALASANLYRYEISNFAQPGKESRHNLLYWNLEPYWGIGISSHSYLKSGDHGVRFHNSKHIGHYKDQIRAREPSFSIDQLPAAQIERLQKHEALTDFFHVYLRKTSGFSLQDLQRNFGSLESSIYSSRLDTLVKKDWLQALPGGHYQLSQAGRVLANLVFEELTFLADDLLPR